VRRVLIRSALVALAVAAAFAPAVAEGAGRRRVRRGAPVATNQPAAPAMSDDVISMILSQTPSGGTAVLPRGTYRSAIVVDRPMRIVGSPGGTTIDADGLGRPALEVLQGVADVTIENVRFSRADGDGVVARGGNDRLLLMRVVVSNSGGAGLRVASSDGVIVDRSTFEANGGGGLDLEGERAKATRLYVRLNAATGVTLRGRDGLVSDCAVQGGTVGISLSGENQSAVRNSLRSAGVALELDATSDTCSFRRNDVRGCAQLAVARDGSTYGTVSENAADVISGDAVTLAGTWHTVEKNRLTRVAGSGVVADGQSLRIRENAIVGPRGDGVVVRGTGNMVDANTVASAGGVAISTEGDGNVVAINTCSAAGADAIQVAGTQNRIVANTVEVAGGEGLVLSGDLNLAQDNALRSTAGTGLHVAGGNGNTLSTNLVLGCGGAGFLDEGTGTVLSRNRID
jgi:hypothetical protein